MKKLFQLLCLGLALSVTSSCNEIDSPSQHSTLLQIDGDCEIYSLDNHEGLSWDITSDSEWIVPVKKSGACSDKIEIYVESNSLNDRSSVVTVKYSNGVTNSTTIQQNTKSSGQSIQRSTAVGWGFDITSYMDSRGLKDQIFNTMKMEEFEGLSNQTFVSTELLTFYGESHDKINNKLNAHLNIGDLKICAFQIGLEGTFGMNALRDSDRIFSWIRGKYTERLIQNLIDPEDAVEYDILTVDFAAERQKVIDSNGSEESIRNLISRYGTHYVDVAYLGGYLDYYFSSVVENIDDSMTIQGALSFGYKEMFKIGGDANYKDAYNSLSNEKIETFSVKGGDAIGLTNKVVSGTMTNDDVSIWYESLHSGDLAKYELVDFAVAPISQLFPPSIRTKIKNYINMKMYYSDLSVTRTNNTNL